MLRRSPSRLGNDVGGQGVEQRDWSETIAAEAGDYLHTAPLVRAFDASCLEERLEPRSGPQRDERIVLDAVAAIDALDDSGLKSS